MDTAVVTGASRGVGEAVARRFAAEGVHVVLCARNGDELDAVVDDIAAEGGAATAVRADARDEYDVERLMETAARAGVAGGIDFVAANAGVYHGAPGETPLEFVPVAGAQYDVDALGGEPASDRVPDAAGGAGDDGGVHARR